jgi:hypothetical protein
MVSFWHDCFSYCCDNIYYSENKKRATDEPASVSDILINSLDEVD